MEAPARVGNTPEEEVVGPATRAQDYLGHARHGEGSRRRIGDDDMRIAVYFISELASILRSSPQSVRDPIFMRVPGTAPV